MRGESRPLRCGRVCRLLAAAGSLLGASAVERVEAREWTVTHQVRLDSQRDGCAVWRAVEGALHRLADPRCQAVLSHFTDTSGRSLEEVLPDCQQTAQERLRSILFYDRPARVRCGSLSPLAATAPGSRAVFVCGAEFRLLPRCHHVPFGPTPRRPSRG